jgi:error-prone DNA polymerase
MVTNESLHLDLVKKKYPNGIQYLISRFRRDYPTNMEYIRRLDKEYKIIKEKGFVQTFHRVCDLLDLIKQKNIPHVLRGSAASSLVCYQLGISDIDPIKQNIPLTRFMNFCRDTQPDIDLDVPHWIRDLLIEEFHEKHPNKVARISNRVMYKPKSAMREAIRKFGYRKFLPRNYKLDKIFPDPYVRKDVQHYAKSLLGTQRQWSLHCGGLIVFNDKVPSDLWLKQDKKQIVLDKYDVEEQNLIKIDLLCNRGLSQLWELSDRPVADYPVNDHLASQMLCSGNILGLTQSESPTMRKTVMALQPKTVYDMGLALALIRPAAADGGRKAAYFRSGGKGKRQIITDEDAIEYISDSIGCSMDFADRYRRGFSKQNPTIINEFMGRLKRKQGNTEQADILKELKHSPKYSYCRGHSLSYGQLVWALAYHKARTPEKFWKATLKHCNSSYRKWVHPRTSILSGNYHYNKVQGPPMYQFEKTGWWDKSKFLSSEFGCEESQGVTYFSGVVANSRTIYRFKKKLVLMTIGVDNNKFIDLIIDKKIFKGGRQWTFVSGCGLRKDSFNSYHIEVSHLL